MHCAAEPGDDTESADTLSDAGLPTLPAAASRALNIALEHLDAEDESNESDDTESTDSLSDARLPTLPAATSRALNTALEHLAAPRHLGLLLYLSLLAHLTLGANVADGCSAGSGSTRSLHGHVERLLHLASIRLSQLVNRMLPGCLADPTSTAEKSTFLVQLVRMQQLTTTWLSLPSEEVPAPKEQAVPGLEQLRSFADQVDNVPCNDTAHQWKTSCNPP